MEKFHRDELRDRCIMLIDSKEKVIPVDVNEVLGLIDMANEAEELRSTVTGQARKIEALEKQLEYKKTMTDKIWGALDQVLNGIAPSWAHGGGGGMTWELERLKSAFVEAVGWLDKAKNVELISGIKGSDALEYVLNALKGQQKQRQRVEKQTL